VDDGVNLADLTGAVVAGDDGSTDAVEAVRWARDDAARRGVPLVVLRAWSLTSAPRPKSFQAGFVPSEEEFADAVREELIRDLATTLGSDPGVEVRALPIHDSANDALRAASAVAAVVVVAARGRGLAKALLGSTAADLVRHSRGPITVVPATR
jgi:nucleotide-binding universal stress UspA family protein